MVGGLFLSWRRPSREQQKASIAQAGGFNYDPRFHAASSPPPSQNEKKEVEEALSKNGFFINRARVLLGSGPLTFRLAKSALLSWTYDNYHPHPISLSLSRTKIDVVGGILQAF